MEKGWNAVKRTRFCEEVSVVTKHKVLTNFW